jgi:isocitrate dehydrogenase
MTEKILNNARFDKAGIVMTVYFFYIDDDKSVADAIILIRKERPTCLVVNKTTPGDERGKMTRKDVVSKIVGPGKYPNNVTISEIISKPLVTVSPDLAVKDCAQVMQCNGIRRVAVYDGKEIVGLLINTDIFNVIKVLHACGKS